MNKRSKCGCKKLWKAKRNYSCQNVILGQVIINKRGLSEQYIKNKEKKLKCISRASFPDKVCNL